MHVHWSLISHALVPLYPYDKMQVSLKFWCLANTAMQTKLLQLQQATKLPCKLCKIHMMDIYNRSQHHSSKRTNPTSDLAGLMPSTSQHVSSSSRQPLNSCILMQPINNSRKLSNNMKHLNYKSPESIRHYRCAYALASAVLGAVKHCHSVGQSDCPVFSCMCKAYPT
jgi:hypothetical protein